MSKNDAATVTINGCVDDIPDQHRGLVDSRLTPASRPSSVQLEEGIPRQIAVALHAMHAPKELSEKSSTREEIIYVGRFIQPRPPDYLHLSHTPQVEWEKGDSRNPANFSYTRKWIITIIAAGLTGLSCMVSPIYIDPTVR